MARIQIMDELLANKIAAGEVVEKIANVVKELVENSIDAKSSEIKIELVDAGSKQIRVIDDGIGMDKDDAVLAFNRHATSKLKTEDQLYHINTLGFRGEALASIASVSQVYLKTSYEGIGTTVKINGGKLISVEASDARKGTIIEVNNLFYNTPARLKHMKSFYAELAAVSDYVNKIALSYPEVKFILSNNNQVLLNTDGGNNLLKTIKSIYGINVVKKMIEIQGETDDYTVTGFITLPEIHRSSRNGIITLVDGRVVRNQELTRIINDSYHSYKPDNRYPIVVLNIKVDPSLIDVNIHPTKMDIKFSKMDDLTSLIEKLIKTKLRELNHTPKIEAEEIIRSNRPIQEELVFDRIEEQTVEYEEPKLQIDDYYVMKEEEKKVETPLFVEEEKEFKEKDLTRIKELYPVGVVHGTYIVCQNEEGMTLIDQHAAKERCNYEMYLKKMGNPTKDSIRPLIPFTFELSNNEFIIIKEHFDILKNIGFIVEEFGINSIIVKAHPTWLPKNYEKEAIERIIESIINYEKNFTVEKFNEAVATMLSCKMAIKANENISLKEMEHLIDDLRKCNNPFHCPHGRPTMISFSKQELEKLFKRSGF